MSLLGIDIGSGSCKGAAFAYDGRILARANHAYNVSSHGEKTAEMDAEDFWKATVEVIRKIATEVLDDPITALSVSSHGESFVALDMNGQTLTPVIMNSDNRAEEQTAWWRENFGVEQLYALTGLPLHSMFALNKIMWLKQHQPELFKHSRKFLSVGDYILYRMGMPYCTDYSLASRTMAFDINRKEWSEEILSAAEIAEEYFPELFPSGTKIGVLSHSMAGMLGLQEGTTVALGGHDQPCGALGCGVINPGQAAVSAGTYECATAVSTKPLNTAQALNYSLNSYCHVVPDRYVTLAFFPAGIATRWFTEQFCGEERIAAERANRPFHDYLNEMMIKASPDPSGICFTPHLVGSCNPYWDVRATGAVAGLTPFKTRFHLYKAIYEAIACELALNLDVLEKIAGTFDDLRINGGNAKMEFSIQLRADLTGKSISVLKSSEAVCLGGALQAGIASGIYKNAESAVAQAVGQRKTFLPDPFNRKAYNRQFEQYKTLYHSLEEFRRLSVL